MKLIPGNIYPLNKKKFCLLLAGIFLVLLVQAQDTTRIEEFVDSTQITTTVGARHENHFTEKSEYPKADTIRLRQVPGTVIDSLKKDDAFWYADYVFKKKEVKKEPYKERKPPVQWLNMTMLIVIVVLFLGILLWYLFQNNIIRKSGTIAGQQEKEEITENIFEIDYRKEIEAAIKAGDHRLAIRLMFLRLLKDLSQKNIIQYKQERTNFDYLSQVYRTSYYNDFFRLTRHYEYTWYGKFEVSPEVFGIIKNEFENFDHKLS